jgi:hypothetical protein
MKRAYDELDRFGWSEQDLLKYDQAEKYAKAYQASLDQKYDEGKVEGKVEVAKILISEGADNHRVQKLTGLSIDIIESLRNES